VTVLVTGAAGKVARLLLPSLREFEVRGVDRADGDLTEPSVALALSRGVSAVVHLAGNPYPGAEWPDLRGSADMVANVLAAAVANDVPRVVLASSGHAMGGHVDMGRLPVSPAWPAYPCCAYGAQKVLAESLGRVYHDQYGLSVVCLRIGGVREAPLATTWLPNWLSPGDLGRAVTAALTADVGYAACAAVSANTGGWWDLANDIGYRPVDDSAPWTDRIRDDTPPPGGPARPRWGLLHRS